MYLYEYLTEVVEMRKKPIFIVLKVVQSRQPYLLGICS